MCSAKAYKVLAIHSLPAWPQQCCRSQQARKPGIAQSHQHIRVGQLVLPLQKEVAEQNSLGLREKIESRRIALCNTGTAQLIWGEGSAI